MPARSGVLYRIEIGTPTGDPGVFELDSYEIAARLSFLLWGSDARRRAARPRRPARSHSRVARAPKRRAMLGDPRARAASIASTRCGSAIARSRIPRSWPRRFSARPTRCIDRVVFDEPRSYLDLFTSDRDLRQRDARRHYGLPRARRRRGLGRLRRQRACRHSVARQRARRVQQVLRHQPDAARHLRADAPACHDDPPPPANVNVDQPPGDGDKRCARSTATPSTARSTAARAATTARSDRLRARELRRRAAATASTTTAYPNACSMARASCPASARSAARQSSRRCWSNRPARSVRRAQQLTRFALGRELTAAEKSAVDALLDIASAATATLRAADARLRCERPRSRCARSLRREEAHVSVDAHCCAASAAPPSVCRCSSACSTCTATALRAARAAAQALRDRVRRPSDRRRRVGEGPLHGGRERDRRSRALTSRRPQAGAGYTLTTPLKPLEQLLTTTSASSPACGFRTARRPRGGRRARRRRVPRLPRRRLRPAASAARARERRASRRSITSRSGGRQAATRARRRIDRWCCARSPRWYLSGSSFAGRQYISYARRGRPDRGADQPADRVPLAVRRLRPGRAVRGAHDFELRARKSVLVLITGKRERMLAQGRRGRRDPPRATLRRDPRARAAHRGDAAVDRRRSAVPRRSRRRSCRSAATTPAPAPTPSPPTPATATSTSARALLADLIHMAFVCDLTRVATLQITVFQSHMNMFPITTDARHADPRRPARGRSQRRRRQPRSASGQPVPAVAHLATTRTCSTS